MGHKFERGQEEILSCVESVSRLEKFLRATQWEVKDSDEQVNHRNDLDEFLGMSTTSKHFDVVSVEGEVQFQSYM